MGHPLQLEIQNYLAESEIAALRDLVRSNQRFVLTTHVNPDGDGLGCELALYHVLKAMGKEVAVLNHSATPELYGFLDPGGVLQKYDPAKHLPLLQKADAAFVLDIGEWDRLRTVGDGLRRARPHTLVCIDHHPSCERIGDLDIVYPQASSTGEILFLLFDRLGFDITNPVATALYTAILTDTGSFRFTNTTVNSHYIAGYLMALGVDYLQLYKRIYESEKPAKVRLLAEMLLHMHFECRHRVTWYAVSQDMLQRYGLGPEDTEGLAEFPRRIAGVEVSVLFLELEKNVTKVSFRSAGRIPIHHFAQMFNGGGHPYASGAILPLPMDEVIARFREHICRYLEDEESRLRSSPPP